MMANRGLNIKYISCFANFNYEIKLLLNVFVLKHIVFTL